MLNSVIIIYFAIHDILHYMVKIQIQIQIKKKKKKTGTNFMFLVTNSRHN